MWKKTLLIVALFFLFALLQNNFFMHFSVFGAGPSLVFAFFFLLLFFDKNLKNYQVVSLAVAAGLFLDVFSYSYIGPSILIFAAVGFLFKGLKILLRNTAEDYPLAYFLPLFLVFFSIYQGLLMVYLRFLESEHIIIGFDSKFLAQTGYSLFFALIGFWIFKKHVKEIQS